jgi:hypothetical protein
MMNDTTTNKEAQAMTIRQHIEAKLAAAVIELRDHCRRQDPTATDDEIAQAINIQLRAWYARNR